LKKEGGSFSPLPGTKTTKETNVTKMKVTARHLSGLSVDDAAKAAKIFGFGLAA
jgi:hypothetical protein